MSEGVSILHVMRPAAGGMRRHISLLAQGLADLGEQAAVAAPPGFTLDSEVKIPLLRAAIGARTNPITDLIAARTIARHARDFDLLHGHGLRGAWIARLAAGFARKPFVWTAHNLAPQRMSSLARAILRSTSRKAARIIAVSQAVAGSLDSISERSTGVTVIPNGIELEPFDHPYDRAATMRQLDIPDDLRLIVGVGRLSAEKGFDVLVRCAPRLLEQFMGACFVLAGDGPERHRLIELVRDKDVEGRFLLEGYFEDIPQLLAAADVVAIPSRQEGQGIVALEAMAARKPVVASDVGGLSETIIQGQTGLLILPDDPAALTDSLLKLLWDRDLQTKFGEAGRVFVEERFTAARMVRDTFDLYGEVLGVGSPVPV